MTVENCIAFCSGSSTGENGIPAQTTSFIYAGVEFGQECCKCHSNLFCSHNRTSTTNHLLLCVDCDNFIQNGGTNASLADCNMACTGEASESCGGPDRLNLFFSGGTPPPAPIEVPSDGQWVSLGCYSYVDLV